jgi:NAD(P)-dependent dehydrogenase (short-subunit alcohol dehydrogenase family)
MPLKPISEQVVVVVGAASALGRAIAEAAAKAGAAVVLADRDEAAVRRASETIAAAGGRAHPVAGDWATEAGCQRIGRAAAARFDRIDGWVDATGSPDGLAFAVEGLTGHLASRGGRGALVAFVKRLPRAAAAELRKARGAVAPTLVVLPRDGRAEAPAAAAVEAALYALSQPMGRMVVASRGRRLTALTEASRHRGVVLGVGLIALAGAAVWLGRSRIATAATAARPRLAKAARPLVVKAVRRRPLAAAKLAAKYPRETARLARLLR